MRTFRSPQEALGWAIAEIDRLSVRVRAIEGRLAGGRAAFGAVVRLAHNGGYLDENELKALLADQASIVREIIEAKPPHVLEVGEAFYRSAAEELQDLSDGIGYRDEPVPKRPFDVIRGGKP